MGLPFIGSKVPNRLPESLKRMTLSPVPKTQMYNKFTAYIAVLSLAKFYDFGCMA
jgi:hypothetical protein